MIDILTSIVMSPRAVLAILAVPTAAWAVSVVWAFKKQERDRK